MIYQKDLHLIFPFIWRRHRVSRNFLCKTFEKKEARIGYIRAFKDMYEGDSTSVKTQGGTIKDFSIATTPKTPSLYLSTSILEVLTEHIQK